MANPALDASGPGVARNTLWNLAGTGGPMLVALVTIPILIRDLGTERFGVLNLAWMTVGYFSVFDFGLGRALTRVVAEKLGTGREEEIPVLFWTALLLMLGLGTAGCAAGIAASAWLVDSALKIPADLRHETRGAFFLPALSIPVTITTAGLRGTLEARQRFRLTGTLRAGMGVFTFVAPVAVLPFSRSLVPIVAALLAGRIVAWAIHLALCLRTMPVLGRERRIAPASIGPLLRTGGWMTVSNVVSPLMATLDRFLLGGLVSLSAVTYYATPFDLVTKLLIVPSALAGVLFPAFAASFVQDASQVRLLVDRAVRWVLLAVFPCVLTIVVLAETGLRLWLGEGFAAKGTGVLQWLAIGVLFNSLAQIPFALLQGTGRADLTARFHLIELPLYVAALWALVNFLGLEGAAIAWSLRAALDMALLFAATERVLPGPTTLPWRGLLIPVAAGLALGFAAQPAAPALEAAFLVVALPCAAVAAWAWLLTPEERPLVQRLSQAALPRRSWAR